MDTREVIDGTGGLGVECLERQVEARTRKGL